MYYDKIEKQKKHIKKLYTYSICGVMFFIAFSVSFIVLFFKNHDLISLLASLFFLGFATICILSVIEKHQILRQYSIITTDKVINKIHEVKLYRPKIKFMVRGTGYKGHTPTYYGITFIDANKNKYYYFFDEEIDRPLKAELKQIEEKLWKELTLQCYENTSIVKTIENDPYFIRIRWGSFKI